MLLLSVAGLIISAVMWQSKIFGRTVAYVGIAACGPDLAYIVGLPFVSPASVSLLAASCLAAAGFLLMVWHLLVGIGLYRLSTTTKTIGGDSN